LFLARPRSLREGFVQRYDDDELVERILRGTPLDLELDPQAYRRHLTELDDVVAHLERIPDINWKLVEPGQEKYVDRCEQCHGPYGRPPEEFAGIVTPPADLSDPAFQRTNSDEELVRTVRRGHRMMPAIPAVRDDADARALVAYLRLLSPGFDTYSRYCAACHGDDGRPQREFVPPGKRPSVTFDRSYLERRNRDQLRDAVGHMLREQKPSMPHFRGKLDRAEARAIVEYIRTFE
ncbi:MAG TPA: c-type cytochrome, partial [Candidatus Binatia bacterium]|nr:c-type cytochrome [Candidatus Binatia bacterium]